MGRHSLTMDDVRSQLQVKRIIDGQSGCWLWQGALDNGGAGHITINSKNYKVARVSKCLSDSVPLDFYAGLCVLHRCDNPQCFNPDHLFVGTQSDNVRDSINKGRNPNAAKVNCPHGHPYTVDNTVLWVDKSGHIHRRCLICKRRQTYNSRPWRRPSELGIKVS